MPTSSPPSDAPKDAAARASFGYRDVAADDKAGLVAGVFARVAPRYDLMNDLMSGGLHRLWRRRLMARLAEQPPASLLDLAGGTGDIAFRVRADKTLRDCAVTVADINPAMLEIGRDRAWDRGLIDGLTWLCADAEALPFAGGRFDACTIAFGIRNVTRIESALCEIARVLAPGGRFLCLELSPAVLPMLRAAYDRYSFDVLPRIGALVARDAEAYRYLAESIRRFPAPDAFADAVRGAGFTGVRVTPLSAGVATLTSAWRL